MFDFLNYICNNRIGFILIKGQNNMDIKNGTGEHKKRLQKKNRDRVEQWFKKNPGSTKTECSKALKLSYPTVLEHIKVIQARESK